MKRIHLAVLAAAVALTAGALYLTFASNHEENPELVAAAHLVAVWAFIGSGLVAWARRPDNRFGVLLTAVGFAWLLGALSESNWSIPFTLGWVLGSIFLAVFIHALLAFPRGYLETRSVYLAVIAAYAIAPGGALLNSFVDDYSDDCAGCPPNAFLVYESQTATDILAGVLIVAALAVLGVVFSILLRRWRAASKPLRRLLAPIYATAGASLVLLLVALSVTPVSETGSNVLWWILIFVFASVPLSFVAFVLRTRLARASVGELLIDLGSAREPKELRAAIRRALGDPTLLLGYWIPDAGLYLDVAGERFDVKAETAEEGRVATTVEHDGDLVAVFVHDDSLLDQPELVRGVCAAASLALARERTVQALTAGERRYRALLDAIPDLMFRMDRDGTYLDFEGDRRDLVSPPEELIGSNVYDVLPQEVADNLADGVREALETGRVVTGDYRLEVEGVPRDWEVRIVKDGEEAVLIVRDITERKRAQDELERLHDELQARHAELERERDFIRTTVDSAPSVFCLVTPGGDVVRFNRTLEAISGRRDDALVRGRLFWDVFVAPEEREEVRWEFEDLSRRGCKGEYENNWVSAGGDRRVVAWSLTPLSDETGAPRYLIAGMDVTERKRQEDELRRSRARIVEAGDVERRRLERNLHDGAQQRLVSLSLGLRLAQARLTSDPEGAERLLEGAAEELSHALAELRELARGIHPAVLTDRGLGAALETLAARAPLPVDLTLTDERLPEPVEAAAYYVVSEALANVTKYAEASAVAISITRLNGNAVVEVADDGVGGADPTRGSGLRGLADRVESLDGRLHVESSPGSGTKVRAEIPCA
ncbi:MAG: PAS domain S-box protein [Gaiellaceae bacterium]